MTGKKHSEETKKKLSAYIKLNPPPRWGECGYKKGSIPYFSPEHCRKISESKIGSNNAMWGKKGASAPNWRGGITPLNRHIRGSFEYRQWRKSVFERDNYICQLCGVKGGQLNVDHIKPFADYPELRFSLLNGRTLCRVCHEKTPTFKARWPSQKSHILLSQ